MFEETFLPVTATQSDRITWTHVLQNLLTAQHLIGAGSSTRPDSQWLTPTVENALDAAVQATSAVLLAIEAALDEQEPGEPGDAKNNVNASASPLVYDHVD